MLRYEIRGAGLSDEEQVLSLARHLNTVNLPNDRSHVRALLELSEQSFAGVAPDLRKRKYVFALFDTEQQRAVGTSTIVAQLGRRDAPYIYLDVLEEEKYSHRLDKHFYHTLLRLGFSYDGPTELAGLVVDPAYRRSPERLGLLISYVRFLFIADQRKLFQDELLAELLPPLESDGTSHLWEALGRRFTDMSYAEADLLSSEDKTFIYDLFPTSVIYASLLSEEAQSVIGKVGQQTKGVEKMLRRVGFRYAERIDPFDGGPHFVAAAEDVSLIQATRRLRYDGPTPNGHRTSPALVATTFNSPPYFRALTAPVRVEGDQVTFPTEHAEHLALTRGAEVICLPLP